LVFKAEVRDVTVKICKQISHEKNYELNKLENTLQSLQLDQDNENPLPLLSALRLIFNEIAWWSV
jgi:hypothetical protein